MHNASLLVAVDIAGCAEEVVTEAVSLATKLGASVHLLHVTTLPSGIEPTAVLPTRDGPITALDLLTQEAQERLGTLARMVWTEGLDVATIVRRGSDPAAIVLATAKEVDAGIIVVGTHGRTGMTRMLMGSVAERIVRHAPVPVLVIRTLDAAAQPVHGEAAQQVLAAADG
jgi:nucleotide-binding universal stress UspA family protein